MHLISPSYKFLDVDGPIIYIHFHFLYLLVGRKVFLELSSFVSDEERFDLADELIFKILNYLKITATKMVPTNIRGSLGKRRILFNRAKDLDMKLELRKAMQRKLIESNIALEKNKRIIEQKSKQIKENEQGLAEIEQKLKQTEFKK